MKPLETERLILRQWRDNDRVEFAALNADPVVMKYFPSTYDRIQSDASIDRFIKSIENKHLGFFAAELKISKELIGFIGLKEVPDNLPFAPAIEIGWRLAQQFWGQGLASEGALACLEYGFKTLGIESVVSMTPCTNLKSERLMQRIGMCNSKQNFIHPTITPNGSLAEHVLYRINKKDWLDNL